MASQTPPQDMIKFKDFKEELHALLDKVLDQAETLQTTAEDPVMLDREWIFERLRDQITTERYILEPGALQVTQGLGNLFKLPRELRDLIYGHAIFDGTTTILLASKQTHKEASKLVFTKGIYRLVLGFRDDVIKPPLSKSLAKNIQNLHIRINSRSFFIDGVDEHLPTLHLFDGSDIQRKNCVVTTECDPFSGNMYAAKVIRELVEFTGFERVIMELDLDWGGDPWPDTLFDFQEDKIWGRIDGAFNRQKKLLEPTLGEGNYAYDEEGLRLAFHPRK